MAIKVNDPTFTETSSSPLVDCEENLYDNSDEICTLQDILDEDFIDPEDVDFTDDPENTPQVPSMTLFDKKMVQRCGVWQIKCMTSQDQDQVLMKSNMFSFGGYLKTMF